MSQKIKTSVEIDGSLTASQIANATTDTDKFLVSDGGTVKYRTGAELAADLGISAGTTSKVQHQVKAGVAINKGQAVYATGANGTNIIVGLASNASEATSSKTMGLLNATVAANGFADVITEGLLDGLNTSAATAGDPIWLGTGGNLIYGLTNKPYAPNHLVFIGIVTRAHTNQGEIFVKVQNGFELDELHDVDLKTTAKINGHILGYDGSLWVNKTVAEWLGYTPYNASNPAGYISSYTETDTLQTVTDRGSITTNPITINSTSLQHLTLNNRFNLIGSENFHISNNAYYSSGFKYKFAGNASKIALNSDNSFVFQTAATGTPDATVTFENKFWADSAGNALSTGSMRSPIFYDYNDTSYYTDPAGASVLNGLKLVGAGDNASGTDYTLWIQGTSLDWGIGVNKTSSDFGVTWNLAASHAYGLQGLKNGTEYFRVGTDLVLHDAQMRAPIFYDYNNTAYYVDPASTSNLVGLTVANTISGSVSGNAGTVDGYDAYSLVKQNYYYSSAYNWNTIAAEDSTTAIVLRIESGVSNPPSNTIYNWSLWQQGNSTRGSQIAVGAYGGNEIYFRGANNDSGSYRGWQRVLHDGNYSSYAVPTSRTITINGTSYDLSADRSWTITGTETDTLATVTGRGASTSTLSNFNGGLTATKTAKNAYAMQLKGGLYGAPRLQLYDLAVDSNAFVGIGVDMSTGSYEFSNYFPRYNGNGRWSVGSWAGDFGTGQYVSGYNEKLWVNESGAQFNVSLTDTVDMRAPIFYDSNNTGYYLDPASSSNLALLSLYGHDNQLKINTYSGGAAGWFAQEAGVNKWETYHYQGRYRWYSYTTNQEEAFFDNASGYFQVRTSMRAPIFYDSNDTAFYLDPASTSNLNTIKFNAGPYLFTNNSRNLVLKGSDSSDIGLLGRGSGDQFNFQIYGDGGTNYGFLNGAWAAWDLRKNINGAIYLNNQSSYYYNADTAYMYRVYGTADMRSAIYYDHNDTSYYADFNSTSNEAIRVRGGAYHGPNPTWGAYLLVGGDGRNGYMNNTLVASVCATDGNLHMDAASGKNMYLNYYDGATIYIGNGAESIIGTISSSGYFQISDSFRAPIFYDSSDTGYYWNPATDTSHRFQTPSGYIDIGPKNTGTCHIYTDRPSFYFNKDILVNGSTVLNTSNAPRAANSYVMFYEGFTLNANDMSTNSTGFTYSNNAPWTGPVARFSTGGGYDLWLNASYGGNGTGLSYRTRNGDAGTYNSWHRIYSDSYRPYADDSGTTGQRSFNYLYASSYLESGGAVYGTIFYDNNNRGYYMDPDGTSQLSSIYTNNWVRVQGDSGVYSQDYGGHLRRPVNASHGTWEIFGYNKNGYAGMNVYDPQGYNNNYMHESGNGGLYQQNGNGWIFYHSRGNACFGVMTSSTSSSYKLYVGGSIYAEGDIVAYSDRRKKENIVTVDNALNTVNKLRGVYYNRIDDDSKKRQIGVIAQEIQEVLPEVVTHAKDVDEYGVSYGNITGLLIEAIKEQQTQIEELKELLNNLINK